jgi:regulator of protease activity HflC (stomatin/prohibitin superfamily)
MKLNGLLRGDDGRINPVKVVVAYGLAALVVMVAVSALETVPAGHAKVGTLFGKVRQDTLGPGAHIVNPLASWTLFDGRQRTFDAKDVPVPSMDQLTSKIDWSIQYRANLALAPEMLSETGIVSDVEQVHLIPRFRSIVRERSKGVARAELWFDESVQSTVQASVTADMQKALAPVGITVTAVLIRGVKLPGVLQEAITEKKKREQEEQTQRAELARFEIEQEQLVKTAQANMRAAELEAAQILLLAEAEAKANKILAASLTNQVLELKGVEKWDGKLPVSTGGAVPFINLDDK